MWLGEIDVTDDEAFRGFWEACKEADADGRPYAAFWSLQEATVSFGAGNDVREQHALAAVVDGTVVGGCQVSLPLHDNTHMAFLEPGVRPAYRGRGIGTALLEAGLALAEERGRTTTLIEVNLPMAGDGPGETTGSRLLERHGFTTASLELHRVLELPRPEGQLAELSASIEAHHAGYRLVAWGSRVPDEHLAGFCRLQEAFNTEAPLGEIDLEPEKWDEARVRAAEARLARQGRHERRVAAIDADGELVALTEMMTTDQQPETAWQGGTLVLKQARGHRLGLATKLANLAQFTRDFPAARLVHSWNAEENDHMVAINEQLGFTPVEYLAEMQRKS